jgi:hypothetical protein
MPIISMFSVIIIAGSYKLRRTALIFFMEENSCCYQRLIQMVNCFLV